MRVIVAGCRTLSGQRVDVPAPVGMVDVFRGSDAARR